MADSIDNGNFQALELDHLEDLDPRILVAFQKQAAEMAHDCMDRPGETGKRSVILQLDFVPVLEQGGTCEEVKTTVSLRSRKPIFKSKEYSAMPTKAGFKFRPGSPGNVRQATLPME